MTFLRSNLLHFRDQRALNETAMAKAAGVTQPTINRFLRGEIDDLKVSAAIGLAGFLKVSLTDLAEHDFRAGAPGSAEPAPDLDRVALASALVALDKTMKALNVPYRQVQDMAETLRYAYKHLVRHPEMPNSDRALFDDALIGKMREDLDAAAARLERRPEAGHRGRAKSPAL
jgi:transcriptional regulator with XRE-family HTH domain